MERFSDRNVGPESAVGDRVSREVNGGQPSDDEGVNLGGDQEFVSDENLAWAKEFLRRAEAHFSGSVSSPPDEAARAERPGSNGSPKAARHRLHRRDRRDRDHASYGSSAAAVRNDSRAVNGEPAAGRSASSRDASNSGRSAASANVANVGANSNARMRGRSAAAGINDGRGVDRKSASLGSESARASSTSGRCAPSAHGASRGPISIADLHGRSAAAGANGGRGVDRTPAAGGSENAGGAATAGCSAAAGDAANPTVKDDSGRHESSAAGGERKLEVSIKNRGWLYLLSSICPGKKDEMLTLFDEVEERHRRLVEESDGSEVAELLADEVMTCWLERMKSSMQEQFDAQSDDTRIVARTRATESATKRLLGALKVYHDYKSEKM